MPNIPEMGCNARLTPRKGGSWREAEGAGEEECLVTFQKQDSNTGLLYIVIKSPTTRNFISVKDAPKKNANCQYS